MASGMALLLRVPRCAGNGSGHAADDQLGADNILETRKNRQQERLCMAEDKDNKNEPKEDIILVAEVRAHLLDSGTVDLLPFKHEEDVRAEINKFIEDWSKTGFLLKENLIYPWHQVKLVEVVSVQAMTHAQASPYFEQWRQDTEAQKVFWKTRKPQGKKEEKTEGAPPQH
jgi:hypothetical protein